jgi:hypothetical protein
MTKIWEENIDTFLQLSDKYSVKMLMVGGGAVNFHGYQRHSADVDFWISTEKDNLNKSFDEAYESAEVLEIKGMSIYNWRVIKYSDLIESKKTCS